MRTRNRIKERKIKNESKKPVLVIEEDILDQDYEKVRMLLGTTQELQQTQVIDSTSKFQQEIKAKAATKDKQPRGIDKFRGIYYESMPYNPENQNFRLNDDF